jgi:hypothetical protein
LEGEIRRNYVILTDAPNAAAVERSTKKRKARVKYADRNGVSVTIRIWKDEYQCLLRYAEDIAKIRGMPKRLPIGETIAYMVRYFNAAQSERWKDVLCIARDAQECVVDHRRFLDADRKRQSRAKITLRVSSGKLREPMPAATGLSPEGSDG